MSLLFTIMSYAKLPGADPVEAAPIPTLYDLQGECECERPYPVPSSSPAPSPPKPSQTSLIPNRYTDRPVGFFSPPLPFFPAILPHFLSSRRAWQGPG